MIEKRVSTTTLGFGAQIRSKDQNDDIMKQLVPQDLVKFGLIPELIGRLPVITSLEALDEDSLVRILLEPKNSVIKQYQKLFEMDGIELVFEEQAYRGIAKLAAERKTGARGLRGIIEDLLSKMMFEAPSDPDIIKIIITSGCVDKSEQPTIIRKSVASITGDIAGETAEEESAQQQLRADPA